MFQLSLTCGWLSHKPLLNKEAAIRLQTDMVVVYTTTKDQYLKYKLFTKTIIKAFATTQLIVLDVRISLVPFSTVITKDQLSKNGDSDLDNNESANRTQKQPHCFR